MTEVFCQDHYFELVNQLLQGVKLRKCNCKTNEIWSRGNCLPAPYTSLPVLIFRDILEPILVNTSTFDVLEGSAINCPTGKYVARIEPSDDLFILSSGFGGSYFKDIVINSVNKDKIKCNGSKVETSIEISNPQNITSSVYLSLNYDMIQLVYSGNEFTYSSIYYNKDDFCLQPKIIRKKIIYEAVFCAVNPLVEYESECDKNTCVRKCCPENSLYSYTDRSCVYTNDSSLWFPHFHRENDSSQVEAPTNLKMSYGFPICKRSFHSIDNDEGRNVYYLLDTGEMHVEQWKNNVPSPRYCLDNFQILSGDIKELALTCFPDDPISKSQCTNFKESALPYFLMVSCLFLLITLIVYAWIPELHAKLHGKSLLSHVTALFIAYFFLALVQWMTKKLPMTACRVFGFLIQISFLASFFWLNVMCFDIWWTLR
ncbi:G-protein coupled receptor Mth [Armadillidium vulgare]|nr:G-protein coupled receptor Mth [Armadillidium vulgare]